MQIQVTGKKVELGAALQERIETELNAGITKYFDRGGASAEVTISKQGHQFKADCWVRLASGQTLVAHAFGGDAHAAFDGTLDHMEKRIRRYKRRLKDHYPTNTPTKHEMAPLTVIQGSDLIDDEPELDDGMDHDSPPQPMIIAETEAAIRTLSVSQAVAELELSNYPVIMFRNAGHGGLSVLYRRPDGNIGWIDPERTKPKLNGKAH
ncbi:MULTISPECIES: ribosome hibernation-promoting factor, HPF/YfiA family [Asticcacaulis]|jgi:ribosomal subunit interface protein|uniref:Ribosome hibernation promoting factor n=2 Tax=Asticcacaulis excentricus TaxID=78587 RepID=E8RNI7_ASTEC|nr:MULTISPECIES: ribosome-associated translation inhibitor RaiA [Asticcacaulis]ADU11818.1 sigma 54 modulation protein/ribosomal protein S30EA [Asticcacaulis excentricus CB 48]MCA1934356.1 ribosome-associated translation inhibitor RaiA [Asticcacaulis sp.]BBF81111.1 ribosomal subunit interface protein [Asticcacaulis excentricus]